MIDPGMVTVPTTTTRASSFRGRIAFSIVESYNKGLKKSLRLPAWSNSRAEVVAE